MRAAGAVPATVAVIDGRIKVGLTAAELERLLAAPEVAKCSTRDLPRILASGGARRDDRRGDGVRGRARRHPDHGDRRPRWRASGRGTNPRRLGRSRGAGAHAGDRGVQRHQVDPGSAAHARAPGDARRAGGRLPLRRAARLLHGGDRAAACPGSTNSTTCAGCTRRTVRSASSGMVVVQPPPERSAMPQGDGRAPGRRGACGGARQKDPRLGLHPVHAAPHGGAQPGRDGAGQLRSGRSPTLASRPRSPWPSLTGRDVERVKRA